MSNSIYPNKIISADIFEEILNHVKDPRDGRALASTCSAAREAFYRLSVQRSLITAGFPKVTLSNTPDIQLLRLQSIRANTFTLEHSQKIAENRGYVYDLSFTSDGSKLVTGAGQKSEGDPLQIVRFVNIWDIASKKRLHEIPALCLRQVLDHSRGIFQVPEGFQIRDLETGKCLHALNKPDSDLEQTFMTPDGTKIVIKIGDNNLRQSIWVWDLTTNSDHLLEHPAEPTCIQLTPDGLTAISGDTTGRLRVWDLTTRECLQVLKAHTTKIVGIQITSDGSKVISGSYNTHLLVWNLRTGQYLNFNSPCLDLYLDQLTMSPDNSKLFASTTRRITPTLTESDLHIWNLQTDPLRPMQDVNIWNLQTDPLNGVFKKYDPKYSWKSFQLTRDGSKVIPTSLDTIKEALEIWDVASRRCICSVPLKDSQPVSITLHPEGTSIWVGTEDGFIDCYELVPKPPSLPPLLKTTLEMQRALRDGACVIQ